MEVQELDKDSLATIFIDPLSSYKELKLFQEIYKDIFFNDNFIKNYEKKFKRYS